MIDDRILCTDCCELVQRRTDVVTLEGDPAKARRGDCLAAVERRRLDVHGRYGPADVDLPRRREFFAPLAGANDRRTGRERYPILWAEYEKRIDERTRVTRGAAQRGIERAKVAIGRHQPDISNATSA